MPKYFFSTPTPPTPQKGNNPSLMNEKASDIHFNSIPMIINFTDLYMYFQCQTLDSIGYAVCGLGCDREKEAAPDFFGTQDAAPFFDFDLQEKFILFVSGKIYYIYHIFFDL